ncbi:uncharacterized protein G2W53_014657 [Senna tora]|uniref:Uncharacterized protein n=1 Tax=Senna tora TaxID=362788 RepID=A0A834WU42_9FABA|nr:uncharacterized protein G2W53_014657 [Senna tora]
MEYFRPPWHPVLKIQALDIHQINGRNY